MWVLLGGLCFILGVQSYIYWKSLKSMKAQLKFASDRKTHAVLRTQGWSKEADALIEEINRLVLAYHELDAKYKRILFNNRQTTASIAHDFRTPLTSMLGYIQLVHNNTEDVKDRHRLEIVEGRIAEINQQVENFYILSTLESQEYPYTLKRMNPLRVLQEYIALYYDDILDKFADVSFEIDEQPVFVLADEAVLKRIYGNLIRNATHHGSETFSIAALISETMVEICFKNRSISKDLDVSRIFERTYSAEKTGGEQSTGLGLAIAYELAQLLEATLDSDQEEDEITFVLRLNRVQ